MSLLYVNLIEEHRQSESLMSLCHDHDGLDKADCHHMPLYWQLSVHTGRNCREAEPAKALEPTKDTNVYGTSEDNTAG